LSLCFCIVLSCADRSLSDGLITRPRNPTQCLNEIKKPLVREVANVLSRILEPLMMMVGSLFNDAFSVTRLYSVDDRIINE
jgi:hypothetical protein